MRIFLPPQIYIRILYILSGTRICIEQTRGLSVSFNFESLLLFKSNFTVLLLLLDKTTQSLTLTERYDVLRAKMDQVTFFLNVNLLHWNLLH